MGLVRMRVIPIINKATDSEILCEYWETDTAEKLAAGPCTKDATVIAYPVKENGLTDNLFLCDEHLAKMENKSNAETD
jgi:hypothetical protein